MRLDHIFIPSSSLSTCLWGGGPWGDCSALGCALGDTFGEYGWGGGGSIGRGSKAPFWFCNSIWNKIKFYHVKHAMSIYMHDSCMWKAYIYALRMYTVCVYIYIWILPAGLIKSFSLPLSRRSKCARSFSKPCKSLRRRFMVSSYREIREEQ